MLRNLFFCTCLLGILLFAVGGCTSEPSMEIDPATAQVALREIGHELLLSQGDSTSRVLLVQQEAAHIFAIQFEAPLTFDPTDLFMASETVLKKTALPKDHTLEVIPCKSETVVYSYRYRTLEEQSLLPCGGRLLPKDCYILQVTFEQNTHKSFNNNYLYIYTIFLIILCVVGFVLWKRKQTTSPSEDSANTLTLGQTTFFPEQHKLLVAAQEVALSRKESELLVILGERPNEVVTREELTKRVWEDHGVVVGRSLDTYISKLRKKLQYDHALQIANVHGVGYKLVVSSE